MTSVNDLTPGKDAFAVVLFYGINKDVLLLFTCVTWAAMTSHAGARGGEHVSNHELEPGSS